MILRTPLTSPVRGARQNGRAPSRAFGRTQKAIYAGSIRIPQDAGYRGYAEDIQLEQQLIRKLLYSPTGLSTFFVEFVQNWFAFSKKPSVLIFGYVPIFPETLLRPEFAEPRTLFRGRAVLVAHTAACPGGAALPACTLTSSSTDRPPFTGLLHLSRDLLAMVCHDREIGYRSRTA